jgi:hypothetical protein
MNTSQQKVYQPYLISYFAYTNKLVYAKRHVFSNDELLTITPESIVQWMCIKAFGVETVLVTDTSALCCSTTLEMGKKVKSFFMPHRTKACNAATGFGNPTKSKEVNDLI